MSYDIFIKQSELNRTENRIRKKDISNMLPDGCVKSKDTCKKNNMIEFRWKMYSIRNNTYIEISKKYPKKPRVYLNKYGKWSESYIDKLFNSYCTEKYYYYTQT